MSVAVGGRWPKPEGWTWKAIADELGIHHDTLYKWRFPERFRSPEVYRRDNARRAEAKRRWSRQNHWRYQTPCPTCGHPKHRDAFQCKDCRRGWRY